MKLFLGILVFLLTSMSPVPEELISFHRCEPVKALSCVVDLYYVCPPGYLDGCITGETRHHECRPTWEGPFCEIPLKLNCPKNFEDGCKTGETDIHFCLPKKGLLCAEGQNISCPRGFVDSCTR